MIDYADKSLLKEFIKNIIPCVLSMLGISVYILVDTFFVATGIGTDALAAMNLALPVFSLISALGLMIGMGSGTRFSILKASNQPAAGNKTIFQAIIACFIASAPLVLIGFFWSKQASALLGANDFLLHHTDDYLRMILIFSWAIILNSAMVCIIRNDNGAAMAMACMLTGSFSNMLLDVVFIYGCKWGNMGAALATGISPLISLALLSSRFIRKKNSFIIQPCFIKIREIFCIISLGFSSFITELSSGLLMLVLNFSVMKTSGDIGLAAYGVIANIALVAVAVFTGIAQGSQPILSTAYGSGNDSIIKEISKMACVTAIIVGIITYLFVFTYNSEITAVFNKDSNVLFQAMSEKGVRIYFLACFIMGINIFAAAAFSAINQPGKGLIISLLRGSLFPAPLILLFAAFFGMNGIWSAIPTAEVLTLLTVTIMVKMAKPNNHFPK